MARKLRVGPLVPGLGGIADRAARPLLRAAFAARGTVGPDSSTARTLAARLRTAMDRGERSLLLGILPAGHNTGVAIVEVDGDGRMALHGSDEEERFTAEKHCDAFPLRALDVARRRLDALGAGPQDVLCALTAWDYAVLGGTMARCTIEEFPGPLVFGAPEEMNHRHMLAASGTASRLREAFGCDIPVVGVDHHEGHAALGWSLSPFAQDGRTTLVTVIDGYGESSAVSLYLADATGVRLLRRFPSLVDSLGLLYGLISSTQGGWPMLSSEGRYMGAAAWGEQDRLANPYYRLLRQIVWLTPDGEFRINRALAGWARFGKGRPYTAELERILGPALTRDQLWHPDAVLDVDAVAHAEITEDRVDKAAALQMVFEDCLLHVIEHAVRTTGVERLVLSGGTALNCVASLKLLEHFDGARMTRLHGRACGPLAVWAPPVPSDAGGPIGAAMAFGLRAGARPGERLRHAFHCGIAPTSADIQRAAGAADLEWRAVGDVGDGVGALADRIARTLAADGVLGLFQGPAEIGPRALGHRSILANPTNPDTLAVINDRVKRRERVRPLAPMVTHRAAPALFELAEGAAGEDHCAYDWMVLAARARHGARRSVPAVVHRDGTSRIQIVRPTEDPLTFATLEAMGRHVGVEVAVNTSLNVGSPIVQTPEQAVEVLRRATAMDGLVMVGDDGRAFLVQHRDRRPPDEHRRAGIWDDATTPDHQPARPA